jgi:hypothetical protein
MLLGYCPRKGATLDVPVVGIQLRMHRPLLPQTYRTPQEYAHTRMYSNSHRALELVEFATGLQTLLATANCQAGSICAIMTQQIQLR